MRIAWSGVGICRECMRLIFNFWNLAILSFNKLPLLFLHAFHNDLLNPVAEHLPRQQLHLKELVNQK